MPHGDEQHRAQEPFGEGVGGHFETAASIDELRLLYGGAVLTSTGQELAERIHGPEGHDTETLATLYQAHVVRAEAAPYDRQYRQDVKDHPAIHQLVRKRLSGEYLDSALEDTAEDVCSDPQLGSLLTMLHSGLVHEYGLYRPLHRDTLPFYRNSSEVRRKGQMILAARTAVVNFVYTLPYTPRYPNLVRDPRWGGPALAQHRLIAEVEFFRRTRLPEAPPAILDAQYARLQSAVSRPRVVNDMSEYMPTGFEDGLPRVTRRILSEARQNGPSQDPSWLRWLLRGIS